MAKGRTTKDDQQAVVGGAAKKQIDVALKNGELTVSPTAARIGSYQAVEWTFPANSSALLVFPDGEPFGATELRAERGRICGNRVTRAAGTFHYQVIICLDGKIYADTSCPTVIIEK